MGTILVQLDTRTERGLHQLRQHDTENVSEVAARLLARAVRANRPCPVYDVEAIRVANLAFVEEDTALAEAGSAERAQLLAEEDRV